MNDTGDLTTYARTLAANARAAGRALAGISGAARNKALTAMAEAIRDNRTVLQQRNAIDLDNGRQAGLSAAMIDRLTLTDKRIDGMADGIDQVVAQPDPVGQGIDAHVRPNGLRIERVRCPLGVIMIIFESRPNVTADAAALCLKSANACILRGGKEAFESNQAIGQCLQQALAAADVPADAVQVVGSTDRALVGELLVLNDLIDVVIPRGGESLIRAVVEQSTIPVIKHYTGNCFAYIDADADDDMAVDIAVNAKTQRTGVCNAMETLLIHRDKADTLLPRLGGVLIDKGVEIRGCPKTCSLVPHAKAAVEDDWAAEYLDMILAVRVVESIDEAIDLINTYGSHHTDAIVSNNIAATQIFRDRVDSASVMINCSTRFSDGFEYGLGAEIGISTDKLHARGPMGAADLCTYKFIVTGTGQIRS